MPSVIGEGCRTFSQGMILPLPLLPTRPWPMTLGPMGKKEFVMQGVSQLEMVTVYMHTCTCSHCGPMYSAWIGRLCACKTRPGLMWITHWYTSTQCYSGCTCHYLQAEKHYQKSVQIYAFFKEGSIIWVWGVYVLLSPLEIYRAKMRTLRVCVSDEHNWP